LVKFNCQIFICGLLGFVGFVVNLLSRPTDGAAVHALKIASEKELLLVRMGVHKITFLINLIKVALRVLVEQKTLYSTRPCVNWALYGGRFTRVLNF
jgi:hypothetical protein